MILHELISYEALRLIWWALLGLLLIAFAVMDGFDLGSCALLPFVARTDLERRVVINTVGPVWEGNQVWLIAGGGVLFAAWPLIYAVAFSGFYFAMFLVLAALIIRPVAFKYRSKDKGKRWRRNWDLALFLGGAVPALLLGVAVGNLMLGLPFHLTSILIAVPDTNPLMRFLILLRPFALLCGVVGLALLIMHGAAWLVLKTDGAIAARARRYGYGAGLVAVIGYLAAGIWLALGVPAYRYAGPVAHDGPSNPLLAEVVRGGSWLTSYMDRPWIAVAPLLGFLGAGLALRGLRKGRDGAAILWSKLAILGVIASVGLVMFPVILPSSTAPGSSLTVWNASGTHMSLFVMLVASVVFLPAIVAYTGWVYRVLWGKVTPADVEDPEKHSY